MNNKKVKKIVKFEMLKTKLKEFVLANQDKENVKLPTVRDLMKNYHVSYSTVLRVLIDLENENYIIKKHGIGIYANKIRQKLIVALLLPLSDKFDAYIWGIIQGAEKVFEEKGFSLIISSSNTPITKNLKNMFVNDISGILLFPSDNISITESLINFLKTNNKKHVFIDHFPKSKNSDYVVNDHFTAGTEIASKIVKKGFKKILYIYANPVQIKTSSVKQKIAGINEVISKNKACDFKIYSVDQFKKIRKNIDLKTTFIITNADFLLQETIDEFPKSDKKKINIFGYGNLFPHSYPTVDQNPSAIGKMAAEILYEKLTDQPETITQKKVPCNILFRGLK